MKLAIAQWMGRVSPVFDVAEQIQIFDLDATPEDGGRAESMVCATLAQRVERLSGLGVETLICGAVSRPLEIMITAVGVQVIPFICGEVEEVLAAYREGTLAESRFAMPGCCQRRRRQRGRFRCEPCGDLPRNCHEDRRHDHR